MTTRAVWLKVLSDHEQDTAEFQAWWRDLDEETKCNIWMMIQVIIAEAEIGHDPDSDPFMVSIGRLAQWAMTEMALREKP